MYDIKHRIKSEEVTIHVVESDDDLAAFVEFIRNNPVIAFDTETTGLAVYSNEFKIRLAQFGNERESFVLPVERSAKVAWYARLALERAYRLIIQNAAFDLAAVARHWGLSLSETYRKTFDTKILAHLVDNRPTDKGGTGHSLEQLTAAYVDAAVAEEVKASMGHMAKAMKVTKGELFAKVSLANTEYLRYSGMDPILTMRVYRALVDKIPAQSMELIQFEHQVAQVCAEVAHNGYMVDVDYTRALSRNLKATETRNVNVAAKLGVENVAANAEVIDALKSVGWTEFGTTEKGAESVDKAVLKAAMESDNKAAAKLAKAVSEAKRAAKWRATWVDTFLSTRDADDRCHPSINTLEARTGRMSITGIPAQTLPSGEASIRSCFVADYGHATLSTDYSNQELRVLAALSGDRRMLSAFEHGEDLHQITADAAHVSRKAGKGTNFAVVFGGGWKAVHDQFGVSEDDSKKAVKAFWSTYSGVKRFADQQTNRAKGSGYVITPSGRRLYIDSDRPYSATNAVIQSTARDITCRGLLRLADAGLTEFIRLPIHDEIVFSVPEEYAEIAANKTNRLMQEELRGLMISTEAELAPLDIDGAPWGSLYVRPDDNRKYTL